MGFGAMKIISHFWKSMIFTIKTCYISIRHHPFVSVTLFILYLLHTFLPSVFGFLVTSSPILVCTAVLLGALLNLGHIQKKPEVDQQKNIFDKIITSRKNEVVETGVVVVPIEKDKKSISIETHIGKRRELRNKVDEKEEKVELSLINKNGLVDRSVVIEERTKGGEKQPIQEGKESIKKIEIGKEEQQNGEEDIINESSSEVLKENKKNKGLKLKTEKPVSRTRLKDWVECSSSSSRNNQIEDNVGESSDCGSDQAQCSSPLASVVEIIPVLDELHPLLDFQTPQSAVATVDESDIASEWSDRSIDGSADSDEEEEEGEIREVEEEEAHESEEEGIKSVVTWTEDDEKNLKDLGTLELERNQRLETLIAKRRARKTLSMDVEINLIDLEVDEPQTQQIPPIVTTRNNNPFDLPYYSNESGEIQPIPASAPSVLLPRRNPFDLPFEPIEERPNLNVHGENVQQVFLPPVPEKEMLFCRHQSFSWGNSFPNHQVEKDKHVIDSSPFLERMESEGKGVYRPTLQRQMTEKPESKLSCVPEHESSSSVGDDEEEEEEDQENLNDEHELPEDQESEAASQEEEVELVEMDHEEEVKSISSSTSEVTENILHENTNEVLEPPSTKGTTDSVQPSSLPRIETEVKSVVMEQAEDRPIKEPVYDSSPSATETVTFEDASDSYLAASEGGTPRVSSVEKPLLSNGSIKNETRPRDVTEVSDTIIKQVGVSEANEKDNDPISTTSKMPEMPSEVEKLEVKEFHPVTPSSSSASEKTILSVEKPPVQLIPNGDHQEPQEFSTPRAIPTSIN